MRGFKERSVRKQAARRAGDLSDEKHKARMEEFDRRILDFQEKWRLCGNRRCRRQRHCLGPRFTCSNNHPPRWSTRQYRRLMRDVVRKPPRV
jgi:hypothetical protein